MFCFNRKVLEREVHEGGGGWDFRKKLGEKAVRFGPPFYPLTRGTAADFAAFALAICVFKKDKLTRASGMARRR